MSKRNILQEHVIVLQEIKSIIKAIKNLALIEVNKTEKFIGKTATNVSTIESAIADLLHFFTYDLNIVEPKTYIIIGSEHGFCGNFNELLLKKVQSLPQENLQLIPIGQKLITKLEMQNLPILKLIAGANVAEEITEIILQLIARLRAMPFGSWAIICITEQDGKILADTIYPFSKLQKLPASNDSYPPLLNLPPTQVLQDVLDHYLFVTLYQIFYHSFYIENRYRMQHMEGALQWLDDDINAQKLLANSLRQEEITEELELMFSNVSD
jgi:F-type H+-transporting ATPase subunit gamma